MFGQTARWGKASVQIFSNIFLKALKEGAGTTQAGSFFQYFTTLTENAEKRWLAPWNALYGCPLRPHRAGGKKKKFGSIFKDGIQVNPKSSPLQGMKAQPLQFGR